MAGFPLQNPGTRELTGGDLLAQSLKHVGVEVAFGLHGGHLDAFLMGCEFTGIKLVDTRHETAAVQAAEAYAKISSKIGVCFVTANSGYSNGIPGLATAMADRSPILCITSSPPLRDAENNSLQGIIDQVVVARPLTKFAHRITNPEDTPRIISLAIRTALSGAPGPVLVDFPIDVLFTPVHPPLVSWGSISSPISHPPGAHTEAVQAALKLVQSANRPVVIIGTGAQSKTTADHLVEFSGLTGIPIFDTGKCMVSDLPSKCKLFGGGCENLGLLTILGKAKPDLVLLLGARTGMFLGGRSGAIIPNHETCQLIQVDVDGSEIGRTLPVDVGVVSDAGQFVQALNAQIAASSPCKVDVEWVQAAVGLRSLPSPYENEPEIQPSGRMHPYHAVKQLFSSLEPGCILVMDGGEAAIWARDVAKYASPSGMFKATGSLGFLGNGFGYALGAAVAAPDRRVVSIHGDGSAGFHFMELDTYKRLNLNIMTVVVNNYCWGMSSNGQELVYGTKNPARPISSLSPVTQYDVVAKGLGNASARLTTVADIPASVKKLQAETGPSCIDLIVDSKPIHPVTELMVGQTDDPNVVVVPYYDNIPRAHYT